MKLFEKRILQKKIEKMIEISPFVKLNVDNLQSPADQNKIVFGWI